MVTVAALVPLVTVTSLAAKLVPTSSLKVKVKVTGALTGVALAPVMTTVGAVVSPGVDGVAGAELELLQPTIRAGAEAIRRARATSIPRERF